MPYPTDNKLRGLARVTFHNDIPNWEFDLRATQPGEDVDEVSDWRRRGGSPVARASSLRAAEGRIAPAGNRSNDAER